MISVLIYKSSDDSNKFSFLKYNKNFIDKANLYPKTHNEVSESTGPLSLPNSKIYTFLARIDNKPYLDNNLNEIILPIKFSTGIFNTIKMKLILGNKNAKRQVIFAKKGKITDDDQVIKIKNQELIQYLIKNDPIIISIISFSELNIKNLLEKKDCNKKCKDSLNLTRSLSYNTNYLSLSLKNKVKIKENLIIGYPYTLIIYAQK